MQSFPLTSKLLYPTTYFTSPLRTTMGISSPTWSNQTLFFPSLLMVNPYFQPLRPNNLESSLIPVFLSQWNIILQEILLCLQNTSVYNNISPLPPWSNPIISHLNYCKSHIAGPPSLATGYLESTLSTKGRWYLKMVSQVMSVICSNLSLASHLAQIKILTVAH